MDLIREVCRLEEGLELPDAPRLTQEVAPESEAWSHRHLAFEDLVTRFDERRGRFLRASDWLSAA